MRKVLLLAFVLVAVLASACQSKADVASQNLSTAADNFQIARRIVFYNSITDSYLLTIEGLCSRGNNDAPGEVTITCMVGTDAAGNPLYKKHFLGLSDNVTYVIEQLEAEPVSSYQYKIIFRPETIVPDINLDVQNSNTP